MNENVILFPVTYKCNLHCTYCNIKPCNINVEKSLDAIRNMKNEWVFITGGEPLLLDNIIDICNSIKLMGKKVGLTTNGTIPCYDIIDHIDRLGVSIDGGKTITDTNRGNGTFDIATKFLKSVVGKVETVIMATVFKNDPELNVIANQLGVDYLQVTHI